ncbi:hypothetical protein GCM10010460_00640 [Microbacterium terrae]|uniref:L-aspartate oxidase n=1 Tax=Microbacterium terrae TaxID=69369 RepID=UPI0022F27F87|nr:FAD-dependent oxidoreductase [Microbacterium terrae]GLJ99540.1 hypothetical protein GCM10017594_27380 [Microbacterium terrae]
MTHAVVVGSGIAGLTVALHAVERGCRVTLVTKDVLEHANTRFAQGGIAGVMFDDDRAADHVRDTLVAGAGLSDPAAVQVLVDEGPDRIRELIALGVAFDRDGAGAFVKGLEAAHSYPRILHAGGDATGTVIERALVAALRASRVDVVEHAFLVGLVTDAGRVGGVDLIVGETAAAPGRRVRLDADAVVLATGGAGELYSHSTNPEVATGDGIAAAMRAGAAVADLEFFQFHPTVLAVGDSFLVSEAVRGEGATLIDDDGRRFAFDDHPDGELAPRDVVARAIARRMIEQGGRPVRLDATHLHSTDAAERAAFLARRFPTIDAAVHDRGLDWALEPVPVTPAAHYLMGGVVTDLDGRTTLPGLYAVGETARTGVHGANRLASNSLLEGAVFGARAGDAIAADAASGAWIAPAAPPSSNAPGTPTRSSSDQGTPTRSLSEQSTPTRSSSEQSTPTRSSSEQSTPTRSSSEQSTPTRSLSEQGTPTRSLSERSETKRAPAFSRRALQDLLWEHAGLVRDESGLAHAASVIAGWQGEARAPHSEHDFEDENLLLVAAALVAAARARRGSVGAHFRSDDPSAAPVPAADTREAIAC